MSIAATGAGSVRMMPRTVTPSKLHHRAAIVLGIVAIGLLWWPRLVRSFWVDEAGTYFVVHQGWHPALTRSAESAGQSILYGVLASFFCLPGSPWMEFVLRLPSVLAVVCSVPLVFKLAEHIAGRTAGAVACGVFLVDPVIVSAGTNARPYALAIAAGIASCWMLVQWLELRRERYLWLFAIASMLTIYLHYLFSFLLAIQFASVLLSDIRRDRPQLLRTIGVFAVIGLSVVPLGFHLQVLFRESHTLSFAGKPTAADLANTLAPGLLLAGAAVSVTLTKLLSRGRPGAQRHIQLREVRFLLLWWFAGPLVFFLLARVTAFAVFVPRYISFARPAVSLVLACLVSVVLTPDQRRTWLIVFLAIAALNPITIQSYLRPGPYECRPALKLAEQRAGNRAVPVLLTSDLAESNFQSWEDGVAARPHLYAALAPYALGNPVFGLPYRVDDRVRQQVRQWMAHELCGSDRIVLVSALSGVTRWLTDYLHAEGYSSSVDRPNEYSVVTFRRNRPRRGHCLGN